MFKTAFAQLIPFYQWTFLLEEQMDEIIGEASGETAFNHMIEMAGYNRNRAENEYSTTFLEAQYVYDKLKEYGINSAKIDRFPGRQTWDGIKGELWEISPNRAKIADYDDLRAMLASGSKNADVTAELVWVGTGKENEFNDLDVNGKIVVTSGSIGQVHNIAVRKGAEGVISFNSPKPLFDPIQIPWRGIRSRSDTIKFGFCISPREGYVLRDRLLRNEKIIVHAVVGSAMRDIDLQVPICVIQGTDPDADEIILSAHLFEGYTKQGANDNISGSAVILEVANNLNTLINEGRLPRPKRNIRFIWVPEFSGTIPWVKKNKDLMEKTLCNINLDMVGVWLSKNFSYFCLMRTTFGNPHYLNDVMEHYYRFVGETNREKLANRSFPRFSKRIVAPSGSEEPFYYKIETHYGASDHEVFNDWGVQVPGIMMITWPDQYYHTSEDRPDKCDPTQLKRAIIITIAAAYTIANADDDMAMMIAGETMSNAPKRMGHQLARGFDELNKSTNETFPAVYKKVRGYIEAVIINEKETLSTVLELATNKEKVGDYIKTLQKSIDEIGNAHLKAMDKHMEITANRFGVKPVSLKLTTLEKKASGIISRQTDKVKINGYRGYYEFLQSVAKDVIKKYPTEELANKPELQKLVNGLHSALDIKKLLDTQYRKESGIQSILNYLEILKAAGLIEF